MLWPTVIFILPVLLIDNTLADELLSARCQAKCLHELELQYQGMTRHHHLIKNRKLTHGNPPKSRYLLV
ncbi:hypothetical protein V3C99_005927 [Haemonchus contortus]